MNTKTETTVTLAFKLEAPEDLMLPDFPGQLPGFDPGEKEGWRCAFITYWEVANGDAQAKTIAPRDWRINGGGFDLKKLPDEYLMAAMEDVALRGLGELSEKAKRIAHDPYSGWQDGARSLLEMVLTIQRARISRHNGPKRKAIMGGVPDEFRDRIRD